MSQPVEDHRRRGRGRFARLALAGVLTAGSLAAVPAAEASTSHTLSSARSHIRSADAALHKVVAGAGSGSVSVPLAALEAQLKAAGHDTAKLLKQAHHTSSLRVAAATAATKLASQEGRDAAALTPLVSQLTGSPQTDLAGFLAAVTAGREQALNVVSQLIGTLPASVQSQVAGVVAELSNAGTGQVGQLAGSFSPGSIACPAIDAVSTVVATVLTSVQADLTRVQSILSFLPAGAQGVFSSILSGLPDQLNSLVATLKQAFDCPSSTPVTGVTSGVGGVTSGPLGVVSSVLGGVTQLVQSLLGSFLPGIGAGTTPGPVTVPAPVTGLLGQVTSLIPGLGSLFGGSGGGGLFGG
ncbi:MAG: hypothetical protein ACR2KV_11655 [Solirubrobacteraceae bacterium]